jgi:hypothetical protein
MIYAMIIILVSAILVYAMISAQTAKPQAKRGRRGRIDREMVAGRWNTIKLTSETGASGLKNSVTEADKLLDYVMKQSGFGGETFADRLRSAESRFSRTDYNAVWSAHKLRNSLAHDVSFDLVPSMAKDALRTFERALKTLGAL